MSNDFNSHYLSNGDSNWDPTALINDIKSDWTLTQYICATKNVTPVQEDPPKIATDRGRIREVKAQSRGERSTQKRYVKGEVFFKLDKEAIGLEIAAETVKQNFLADQAANRRHYHTKKGKCYEKQHSRTETYKVINI